MYSAFARRLFDAPDANAAAKEIKVLIGKLRERVPPFDEFSASFRQIVYTNANSKQKNLVRYILRKFANSAGYKYAVDFDELTIEHVASQALIKEGWDAQVVGQIGNLMFLDPATNVKLGNKDFAAKMEELKQSGHSVPDQVASATNWTEASIKSRTKALAQEAYGKIWKI